MKKQTIGLCMIVKNEAENIRRVLESVVEHVDVVYLTDTGSTDDTIKIAKEVCKRFKTPLEVSHFDWVDDFAAARNYNFDQAKTDWVLWLDADDTLDGADSLQSAVDSARAQKITGLSFTYRYHVDKHDIDKAKHPKLRLVVRDIYEWSDKAPIHENLFIKPSFRNLDHQKHWRHAVVRHWKDHTGFIKSGERNLRILNALREKEQKAGKLDPRTTFLLGREYHSQWKLTDSKQDKESSAKFLNEYINTERSGGERMSACSLLFDIYTSSGNYNECLDIAFEAVKSHPSHPLGYILVGKAYSLKGNWNQTIEWVMKGTDKDVNELDGTVDTPKGLMRESALLLAEAYMESKDFEKSLAALYQYQKIAEDNEQAGMQERIEVVKSEQLADKILKAFVVMGNVALQDNNLEKSKHLIETIPNLLRTRREVVAFKRKVGLSKKWAKGNIVIFCGGSYEPWDEESLKKGIGGSETAVIEQARRWGLAGYKVTVYNSVEEIKRFGNVTYVPFNKANFADHYDIFISWRNPLLASKFSIHAEIPLLWLHDVPNPLDYTQEVIDSYKYIIVLSKFHRAFLPAIADEKFYISSNGINVEMIEQVEKENIERKPRKIIYASSPDRGLENLLDCLEEVKKQIPDLEAVWAYGWDNFDALRGHDPAAVEWKKTMQKRMKELGVKELGRIGKEELLREYMSSSVWAYPTNFEEINCIVAQEAQASGCYPVTTGYAALDEVQRVGIKTGYPFNKEVFTKELINAIKAAEYERWVYKPLRKEFSWQKTAESWMRDLFYGVEFEHTEPLVSVVCITIRPGIFRVLRETLEKQTYQNFELIVIDGRYDERKEEVEKYMKDFEHPFLHLGDPDRDTKKYPYGLYHADNAALAAVRGDLTVFLQDFIEMPEDGIEKFVELYKANPGMIYTGVDTRNQTDHVMWPRGKERPILPRSIDIYEGEKIVIKDAEWKSPRIKVGGALRVSEDPFEWELNYAAAPTSILKEMGGWDTDWDTGFGYDNTIFALRFIYEGGSIIVDETNQAIGISHWQLFGDDDKEGVPHRTKKTNDNKFQNYIRYLQQRRDLSGRIKLKQPKFRKDLYVKLQEWLKQKDNQ